MKLGIIADYASVTREGKLNIMGIFHNIYTRQLPAVHPQMYLVLMLEGDSIDASKEHDLSIKLVGPDGEVLLDLGGKLRSPAPPPGERAGINHVMQLNNINFKTNGPYEFKITMDSNELGAVALNVKQAPQGPQQAPPGAFN